MAIFTTIGTDLTAADGSFNFFNNIENDDVGVSYSSLTGESQIPDLFWQAYGVGDAFGGDFELFVDSQFEVDLFAGTDINWGASFNADGTYHILPGPFGASAFSTGKTAETNYSVDNVIQFNNPGNTKTLLDADGDGNTNYELKLLSDVSAAELSDALTIVGQVGANNGGNSITANTTGTEAFSDNGNAYVLVPTEFHPEAVPEASAFGLLLGALAFCLVAMRR